MVLLLLLLLLLLLVVLLAMLLAISGPGKAGGISRRLIIWRNDKWWTEWWIKMNRKRITSCQAPSANLFHHQWVQHRFAIVLSTGIAKISSALKLQETLSLLVQPTWHKLSVDMSFTPCQFTLYILHLFTLYLDVDITSSSRVIHNEGSFRENPIPFNGSLRYMTFRFWRDHQSQP